MASAYAAIACRAATVCQYQPEPGCERHAHHQRKVHGTLASEELDEDSAVLDSDRETGHLHGGVVGVGAGRDVPAPGVPGAHDDPTLEVALAERPAAMGARVVDRVVGAVDVEEREHFALRLDHATFARGDVAHRCQPDPAPLSHCRVSRSPSMGGAPPGPGATGSSRGYGRSPCRWPA